MSTFTARHCILIESLGSAANLSKATAAADSRFPLQAKSQWAGIVWGVARRQRVKVTTADK